MKDAVSRHHGPEDHEGKTFAQAAMEVLQMQKDGFEGPTFEGNESLGKEEMKGVFGRNKFHERGVEQYDSVKLSRIMRFLTSRVNNAEVGELRSMLDQRSGVSSIPPAKDVSDSATMLQAVLSGSYNETIDESGLASRSDVYTVALYLYMNAGEHSEEEMTKVLGDMVATYDDYHDSVYIHDIEGMHASPFLARLCRKAIETNKLQGGVRAQVRQTLDKLPENDLRQSTGRSNAYEMGLGKPANI